MGGAFEVLCDCRLSFTLKGIFYRMIIRLVMMYRSEWWVDKKQHTQRMDVDEMRMLRWLSVTIND